MLIPEKVSVVSFQAHLCVRQRGSYSVHLQGWICLRMCSEECLLVLCSSRCCSCYTIMKCAYCEVTGHYPQKRGLGLQWNWWNSLGHRLSISWLSAKGCRWLLLYLGTRHLWVYSSCSQWATLSVKVVGCGDTYSSFSSLSRVNSGTAFLPSLFPPSMTNYFKRKERIPSNKFHQCFSFLILQCKLLWALFLFCLHPA